jgi:hypothetical protein
LSLLPKISKIYYCSDGCTGQYKNGIFLIFIFISVFGIECKWHSSHVKSLCDGIGGVIKRGIANASIQRPFKRSNYHSRANVLIL